MASRAAAAAAASQSSVGEEATAETVSGSPVRCGACIVPAPGGMEWLDVEWPIENPGASGPAVDMDFTPFLPELYDVGAQQEVSTVDAAVATELEVADVGVQVRGSRQNVAV